MNQQQTALPDPDSAYNHLFNDVHSRVFFTKLAQAGIQPQNEKEAEDLFTLAGQLREVNQQEKMAAASTSRFSGALSALNNALGARGWDGHMKTASAHQQEMAIKQAAAGAADDPLIYNSVLSLIAAEAAAAAA